MITGKRISNLKVEARTQDYAIISDVLPQEGGNNEGPNPHELLEAALAACTMITLQMYAHRKKWDLQSANTLVKIIKEEPGVTVISVEIELIGNLDSEQKQRLFEIANKCPIHKILASKIEQQTKLVN